MTIQEAISNVLGICENASVPHQTHHVLVESIRLIATRCKRADELEKKEESEDVK